MGLFDSTRTFASVSILLTTLVACDNSSPEVGATAAPAPSAQSAQSAQSAPSAPATTAGPVAAAPSGKLTPSVVMAYAPKSYSFPTADAAIAAVTADLGPPTYTSPDRVSWGAVDDKECATVTVQRAGGAFVAFDKPPKVEKKSFGEQWGKLCLQFAGQAKCPDPLCL